MKLENYTYLNYTTQQAQRFIYRYDKSNKHTIYEAYNSPSTEKVQTFYELVEKMKELGGRDMRITGAGSNYYSCAYLLDEDSDTYLIYETHANTYKMKYKEAN